MSLRLIAQGTVFEGKTRSQYQSALYPGICVLPSGRCIVTFRAAPFREATNGGKILMCFSDGDCSTWSEPYEFFKTFPMVHNHCGEFFLMYVTPLGGSKVLGTLLWVDTSKPERPYYNPETHGIIDHKIFFTRSFNNGKDWETPYPLSGMPHSRPTALTSPTILFPDGKLGCQFEVHKHYDEPGSKFFEGAMIFSSDGGKTWGDYSIVSHDPHMRIFWWDQRINLVGDKLLGLFWTYDDKDSRYLNIHAAQSSDFGKTWGEHYDTGVLGQPSQPVALSDGSIAMAYIDRTASPAIKIRQSFDGGITWPPDTELVVFDSGLIKQENQKENMNDMWREMYLFSVGFPVAAVLPNGDLIICYYSGPHADRTAIRWAIIGK